MRYVGNQLLELNWHDLFARCPKYIGALNYQGFDEEIEWEVRPGVTKKMPLTFWILFALGRTHFMHVSVV